MSIRVIVCALFALAGFVLLAGCGSARANAQPEAILVGYQPAPEHNPVNATLERVGENRFVVRVNNFDGKVAVQKNELWCWAAVSETVLRHASITKNDGTPVTQDDLVRGLRGHKQDQSADEKILMLAMSPEAYDEYEAARLRSADREGRRNNPPDNVYWEEYQPSPPGVANAVRDLLKGGIVAIAVDAAKGDVGHIYVADEAEFSLAEVGGLNRVAPYFVHRMNALDPNTGERVTLVAEDQLARVTLAGGRLSATEFTQASIAGYKRAKWERIDQNYGGATRSVTDLLGSMFK